MRRGVAVTVATVNVAPVMIDDVVVIHELVVIVVIVEIVEIVKPVIVVHKMIVVGHWHTAVWH